MADIFRGTTDTLYKLVVASNTATTESPLFTSTTMKELSSRTIMLHLMDLDPSTKDKALIASYGEEKKKAHEFIHYFRNTPDESADIRPARTTITQTRGGYWIDDFGPGVREIHLKGNTGFRKMMEKNGTREMDGKQLYKNLARLIRTYQEERQRRRESRDHQDPRLLVMVLRMFTEEDVNLIVHPMSFNVYRSKSNPMMYTYDIKFVVLGDYKDFRPDGGYDEVVEMLHDPKARLPKIYDNLVSSLGEVWGLVLKNPAALAALSDEPSKRWFGKMVSIIAALSPEESDKVTKVETLDEAGNKVLKEKSKRDAVAEDIMAKAISSDVTKGVTGGLAAIATQDAIKSQLNDLTEYPTQDVWTASGVGDFNKKDTNALLDGLTALGASGYDAVRSIRQMQTCLNALSKYPELFGEAYEEDMARRRAEFLTSGCATTLMRNSNNA